MLFNVEINNQEVSAKKGETILSLLNRNGISVPTLCNLAGMTPSGSCRMCIVEVEGMQDLVPACSHPVEEWMRIKTHSPRVMRARRTIVELLLASHPDDCLYCDRSGACELQDLAVELNIRERRFPRKRNIVQIDKACQAIERDPSKCILCGRCILTCNNVIGVHAIDVIGRGSNSRIGTSYNKGLNFNGCVKCGQCITVCPTGALTERSSLTKVLDALHNPELTVALQFSPTTPASITEDFGLKPGKDVLNLLRTALRMIGFDYILDTSFGADVAIMEEAAEIQHRLRDRKNLPVLTASCPSWVKYIHEFRPAFIPNLLSTKSPQQIMGTLIKNYFISNEAKAHEKIFSVSVMPCTSKKYEADKETNAKDNIKNVDAVLTTRELVKLIRLSGIDLASLEPEPTDTFHGIRSSAGKLFGVAGGPLEGTVRTLYNIMTSQELSPMKISDLRGLKEIKEARIKVGKQFLNVVAVSGLANAIKVLDEIESGRDNIDILEVMACPYGCINGGGQKIGTDDKSLKSRMKAIYDVDEEEMIKVAHKNPNVGLVYERVFGKPGSPQAMELLHNVVTDPS
jgi:iron-only hydrogenase group A